MSAGTSNAVPQPTQASDVAETLYCPDCNYDLRGIGEADRCPECGLAIDRDELATSRIPWVHRHRIGRFRAYWRTVWLAMVRTKSLGREVHRPVAYADAQRFRVVTCLLACAVPAVTLA